MAMFKSAFGYLSSAASGTSSTGASREENDFVGQTICLGNFKLRVLKVIAEGQLFIVHLFNKQFRSLTLGEFHVLFLIIFYEMVELALRNRQERKTHAVELEMTV